ncbi:MAG TPA: hypothetical protein DGT21_11080 [Armatimonadetes bacterium]|jgi:hypothetical protein|nr:hypothetical protein [Armatimonadota bacterium]
MDRSWMIVVAVVLLAASPNNAAEGRCVSSLLTATESACATQYSSETAGSGSDFSGPEGAFFGVFMLGMMLFYFGIFAFAMLAWVLAVLALWDCARRDFPDPNSRAGWAIVIMLTHWIGALVYYIVIYRADDPPYQPRPWADARTRPSVLEGATAPRRRDAEKGTGNADESGADTEQE